MNWKRLTVAALVAAGMAGMAVEASAGSVSPLAFSLAPGAQLPDYDTGVVGLRLGLFGAANRVMCGVAVSLVNTGAGTESDGELIGLQVGLANVATSMRFGAMQIAGVANNLSSGGIGVQLAGLVNFAEGEFHGFQLAGFQNEVKGDGGGVQIGFYNGGNSTFDGVQLGVINYSKHLRGVQLGAINTATSMHGMQIGAFNFAGSDMKGVSIGIINGNTDGAAAFPLLRIGF